MQTKNYLFIIYGLYASFLFGLFITPLAGVIMAYLKRQEFAANPLFHSHNEALIRIFWISLAANVVGWLLVAVLVGWLVLAIWALWLIYRLVKGAVALNDNQSVDPRAWL